MTDPHPFGTPEPIPTDRRTRPLTDLVGEADVETLIEPPLHVALFQPEIPPNTGNIGRTCVAVGAKLWLIKPLGFSLDASYIKRSGVGYWPLLNHEIVDDIGTAFQHWTGRRVWRVTKFAEQHIWDVDYQLGDVLLFGRESDGLPPDVRDAEPHRQIKLPMRPEFRSLNLASTVNTCVYEAIRQFLSRGDAGE